MDLVTLLTLCALRGGPSPIPMAGSQVCRHEHPLLIAVNDGLPVNATPGNDQLNPSFAIDQWQPFIAEASRRFGILEQWIHEVMRAESGGRTILNGHPITSPVGAMGLMQVMPDTYEAMRVRHGLGANPYDPHDNVLAGTAYLREMYDRYGYPGLFAAYNAGPDRFDAYLLHGRTLPDETWNYLATINPGVKDGVLAQAPTGSALETQRPLFASANHTGVPSGTTLFFKLGASLTTPLQPAPADRADPNAGRLFVPLAENRDVSLQAGESHE